jgi:hypothetical protein
MRIIKDVESARNKIRSGLHVALLSCRPIATTDDVKRGEQKEQWSGECGRHGRDRGKTTRARARP